MSKRMDKEFLLDIQEAIRRIELYTKGLKYEDFLQRIETQDAVLRNLEIIGEAVKNLSLNLKKKYQDIPWKDIARMRDKIIHFYFGVNLDIVWKIVEDKLPQLKKQVEDILKGMK
ncbi:MAG: HepT-like ribonuclease domain-containing protein [bacterium JZ-2024 1]